MRNRDSQTRSALQIPLKANGGPKEPVLKQLNSEDLRNMDSMIGHAVSIEDCNDSDFTKNDALNMDEFTETIKREVSADCARKIPAPKSASALNSEDDRNMDSIIRVYKARQDKDEENMQTFTKMIEREVSAEYREIPAPGSAVALTSEDDRNMDLLASTAPELRRKEFIDANSPHELTSADIKNMGDFDAGV